MNQLPPRISVRGPAIVKRMRTVMGLIGMSRTHERMNFVRVAQDYADIHLWNGEEAMHKMLWFMIKDWLFPDKYPLLLATRRMERRIRNWYWFGGDGIDETINLM